MNRPVTNTAELLQGVVPGMEIRRTNQGKVGEEGYSIQVRGVTSRSDPGILVVVDGIPYKDNNADALNKINPQDIENITILKDAQPPFMVLVQPVVFYWSPLRKVNPKSRQSIIPVILLSILLPVYHRK